jgi:hypothetical protein
MYLNGDNTFWRDHKLSITTNESGTGTGCHYDQVVQADHLPKKEGKQKISHFFKSNGHSNFIQALAC